MTSPIGNMTDITKARIMAPAFTFGQKIVLIEMEEDELVIHVFEPEDEKYARALAELTKYEQEHGESPDRESRIALEGAEAKKFGEQVLCKRHNLFQCCKEWKSFLGEVDAPPPPPPPPPPPNTLVGKIVENLPCIEIIDDEPETYVVVRGCIESETATHVIVVDGAHARKFKVKRSLAESHIAAERVPIDASGLRPELLRIAKAMPHSMHVAFSASELCAVELLELARVAAGTAHIRELLVASAVDSKEFAIGARLFLAELNTRLEQKVLGSSWPSNPTALGKALAERAAAGEFAQIQGVRQLAPTALPAKSKEAAVAKPLSHALRSACISASEWSAFLKESVAYSESDATRRATVIGGGDKRMTAVLEQFLKWRGASVASLSLVERGRDAEDLLDVLRELEHSSTGQPAANSASPAGGAATMGDQIGALAATLSSRKDSTDSESRVKGAIRDAARRVAVDDAALARLRNMQEFTVAKNYPAIELLKSQETNPDVLLLLSSEVDHVASTLAGVLGDGYINVVSTARDGLDDRLCATLWPAKPKRSPKQRAAIGRVRVGRLSRVDLTELLDLNMNGANKGSIAVFGKMKDGAAQFNIAISLLQQIVSTVSPAQTNESMSFFRQLQELVAKYLARGATWEMLSEFYEDVLEDVEKPAVSFSRGAGGGSVLLTLDLAFLKVGTERRTLLEEQLSDSRRGGNQTAAKPKLTTSGGTSRAGGSSMTDAEWKAAVEKLRAAVPKKSLVQGGPEVLPCPFHFIKGTCSRGDKCKCHHVGTAGSFAK